jgi:hypothetical protein
MCQGIEFWRFMLRACHSFRRPSRFKGCVPIANHDSLNVVAAAPVVGHSSVS